MTESITKQVSKYKLVFIGDQSVGKTSIINRFIQDTFIGSQQPTVGIDFVSKTLLIDNKTIRLQLWDTAGQERFRSLIPSYIRDSDAAIICYDATNQNSFQSIERWLEYVRDERGDDVLIVLVGNKCDLIDNKIIQKQEVEQLAQQQSIIFFETSAKEGTNIQNLFKTIASTLQNKSNPQIKEFNKEQHKETIQLGSPAKADTGADQKKQSCQC